MTNDHHLARFDKAAHAVVIESLTVRDKDVTREALRWTNGERGPIVDPDVLLAADPTVFVTEAIKIGAMRCRPRVSPRTLVLWSR